MRVITAIAAALLVICVSGCSPRSNGGVGQVQVAAVADTAICVVDRASPEGLAVLQGVKWRESGQLLVNDRGTYRDVAEVLTSRGQNEYARGRDWFAQGTPIRWHGRPYLKYGVQRVVAANRLRPGGDVGGVMVFLNPEEAPPPKVLYVPTEPGCIFQPYMLEMLVRRARGE